MPKENLRAYIAWAAICLIWGTTYLAIRIGVKDLPPALFAGFRWLAAGPVMILILKLRGYKLPLKKDIKHIAVVGLLLLGFGNGLVVFAEQWLPSGITALLITTVPFWIVGLESFLPARPKMNLQIFLGLLLGLSGVVLILGIDINLLFNADYLIGIFALMIGVFCWSSGTLYSKYKKVSVRPLMSAAVQMTTAGSALTLLGVILGEPAQLHITQSGLLAFLYLLILGSFIGYGAYIYAVANLPVSFVSTYAYINPIIALFLGWLVLDEELTITTVIAALIILSGVYIVKRGSYTK